MDACPQVLPLTRYLPDHRLHVGYSHNFSFPFSEPASSGVRSTLRINPSVFSIAAFTIRIDFVAIKKLTFLMPIVADDTCFSAVRNFGHHNLRIRISMTNPHTLSVIEIEDYLLGVTISTTKFKEYRHKNSYG